MNNPFESPTGGSFTVKPDIIIDDTPSTCIAPFIYDVQKEQSWPALAEHIIDKHID